MTWFKRRKRRELTPQELLTRYFSGPVHVIQSAEVQRPSVEAIRAQRLAAQPGPEGSAS